MNNQELASLDGYNFFYYRDINVCFRGDTVIRNLEAT